MYETVGSIGWGAMPYILLVYILGNILLMNLFISILIDTFVQTTVRCCVDDSTQVSRADVG